MTTDTPPTITLPDGRVMPRAEFDTALAKLTAPFAPDQIEKLPKQVRRDDQARAKCERGERVSMDGHYCGGFHALAFHLDYIGHAGITMRLGEVDPFWNWEPVARTPHGTPMPSDDGMWITLTVLGITRLGFGDASGKRGPNAVKEMIGDALRNAAMRFGVGTYLWSKSEAAERLKMSEAEAHQPAPAPPARQARTASAPRKAAAPAPAPARETQSTRDWKAELEATRDADTLRELYAEAVAAGLFVRGGGTAPEQAFTARARALAPQHNTDDAHMGGDQGEQA